jgi:hypothetical protein
MRERLCGIGQGEIVPVYGQVADSAYVQADELRFSASPLPRFFRPFSTKQAAYSGQDKSAGRIEKAPTFQRHNSYFFLTGSIAYGEIRT